MSPDQEGVPARVRELLTDVLAGSRTTDDPAVVAACADPKVAQLLREMLAVQSRLSAAGSDLLAMQQIPPAPLDFRIAQLAHAHIQKGRGRSLRGKSIAIAAAALLVVGTYLLWPTFVGSGEAPPRDHILNGDAPQSAVRVEPDFAAIGWAGSADPLWFQVRVRTPGGSELERSTALRSNTWKPRASNYPTEVIVELHLVDFAGQSQRRLSAATFGRDGVQRKP
jgi:hypothetical protein